MKEVWFMEDVKSEERVDFYGSQNFAFIPIIVFIIASIILFGVMRAFSMVALGTTGLIGLIIGTFFAKDWKKYWNAVQSGASSPMNGTLIMILFVVGVFTQLMAQGGVAEGFVWLGDTLGLTGSLFCAFAFIATCIIAVATGTSIGTISAAVPILYPSGFLLGANPFLLVGAILSGAIFGDNLAPVSDTTIVSSSTQWYTRRKGSADIGGVVASRFKYAIIAAVVAVVVFLIFGGGGSAAQGAEVESIIKEYKNAKGLIMLIPVVVLLWIAIKTRQIFTALIWGTIVGAIVALLAGIIQFQDIFYISDGNVTGFIVDGVNGMVGVVTLCIMLFGIIGVMEKSEAMSRLVDSLIESKLARTPLGTEIVTGVGMILSGFALAAATGPALIMFGPLGNKIGQAQKLHPYRRANLMDGFGNTLPIVMPFSAFVFIMTGVIKGIQGTYEFLTVPVPTDYFWATIHPWALFIVFVIAVLTGWGRAYEGKNGAEIRSRANKIPAEALAED
jgi:Na+/H+ antiporter NhaC